MTMNSVFRALARIASSQSTPTKHHPSLVLLLLNQREPSSRHFSSSTTTSSWSPFLKEKQTPTTKTNTKSTPSLRKKHPASHWPRPKEIPFQGKVANSVNLVGHVNAPIQSQVSSPDGKYWASTVITQDASFHSPAVRIPIIFEGDLAHIAASHLKKGDHVYIAGQLTADPPPLAVTKDQAQVQVLVQNINFVEGASKKSHSLKQEEVAIKDYGTATEDKTSTDGSWMQLLVNPHEWWDIRSDTENSKGAAFERKNDGKLLWIDGATPKWIQQQIEVLTFDQKTSVQDGKSHIKKETDSALKSWEGLLDNPKLWWDFRGSKLNGSVSQKHPDFKRKDGGLSLWLDCAPAWVLAKIEGMEFDLKSNNTKQPYQGRNAAVEFDVETNNTKQPYQVRKVKGEESWKDLVENPSKWWDNRLDKKNVKYPDFKHKETGEALWLNSSPPWVLEKLPPPKSTEKVTGSKN